MENHPLRLAVALGAALLGCSLAACGGSSGVSTSSVEATTVSDLSGVAAVGTPFVGAVFLSDASAPAQTRSTSINEDGSFSFSADDLKGLVPPYLLKARAADGSVKLFSFASGPGKANVNPVTNLTLAVASGFSNLSGLYQTPDRTTRNAIASTFASSQAKVMTALGDLLTPFGAGAADPAGGFFAVNRQGLDGFLDQVNFAISPEGVTIADRTSHATVFTASLSDIAHPTVNAGALSPPPPIHLPGNAVLTLALRGTLPVGTAVKYARFTLQLPLGITVDTGPSGVNTALPIGAAVNSSVYPAPSLSDTDNQLSANLSSLDGFGTGTFIAIRCTIGSPGLLTSSAADFSITSATLYSDIYKNTRIKGMTIVPVSLVFTTHEGKGIYDSLCASCHNLSASDTTTASLYNKADKLSSEFAPRHHNLLLTATQRDYLSEFLQAVGNGQAVF